jgi:hypothetical protein
VADLPRLVMNDPGHAAYVTSYARLLAHGMPVLFEDTGHGLSMKRPTGQGMISPCVRGLGLARRSPRDARLDLELRAP